MRRLIMVQIRTNLSLALQNPPLEPPRQHRLELILRMNPIRHSKDIVELLQGLLLRLGHKEED